MNICILYGKIISKIEFEFLYNSKKHISVLTFELLPEPKVAINNNEEEQPILIKAYDKKADIIYRNFEQLDYIYLEGYATPQYVEVNQVY